MLLPFHVTRRTDIAYLAAAQQLYLELRGGGLFLSPLDTDRILAWRNGGLPLELVLRGIRAAHKAWSDAGRISRARPFQLRHAEKYVEELAREHARRFPGGFPSPDAPPGSREQPLPEPGSESREPPGMAGAPAPAGSGIQQIARHLLERLDSSHGATRASYEAALAAVIGGLDLLVADELQARAYLSALPRAEQRRLSFSARLESGPRAGIPRTSYRSMLRACLWEAARMHGQLLRPSDLP